MSLNPLAQNVQAPRRALRRVALLDVDARGCLFPRLTWQPLNLNVCWSGERYLAAATLRPPIPVPEKRWKPQPIISKYLGVPKHCLHFGYEGSNQSLLRKLHKHFGAASSLRAACQSCKKVRAMSKVSRRRTTSLLHQGRLLCVHPESAQRKQLLDRSML